MKKIQVGKYYINTKNQIFLLLDVKEKHRVIQCRWVKSGKKCWTQFDPGSRKLTSSELKKILTPFGV